MASGPVTSWQIDGETVETVADLILGGSKITADGDFSHEIKRRLLLGRKVMTNLDSILKSRDITLSTKVHLVKAMVFPSHVWTWELDYKERWAQKNWCFGTVVLEKTLESPLDCKEIQPVHPRGNQSWVFSLEGLMLKLKLPILWPPDVKSWLIWKDPDAGKDWGQEEKGTTEDEMVGWHHQLNGHGFGWTPGVGDGQRGLACCGSWGRKESDTTEWLNWTENKTVLLLLSKPKTACDKNSSMKTLASYNRNRKHCNLNQGIKYSSEHQFCISHIRIRIKYLLLCLGKICTTSVVIWWKFHFLLRQYIQELFFISLILQEWTPNHRDFVLTILYYFYIFKWPLDFFYLFIWCHCLNVKSFLYFFSYTIPLFLLLHFFKFLFVIQFLKLTFHLPFIAKYWLCSPWYTSLSLSYNQ